MATKHVLAVATVLAVVAGGGALAAQSGQMPTQQMPQHHGMMGQEQQGQGMMACPMMSGGMSGGMGGMMMGGRGMMMGGRAMPAFPPGNEKLQLQMQAEIMQKVGEIMAKYAAQLPDR